MSTADTSARGIGYKKTVIGDIPDAWSTKMLGEVGEALIGLTYQPGDVRQDRILVLRSSNIQSGALDFEDNVFVQKDIADRIMVRPGDVLICVRNGSRPLIGKSALLDKRAAGMTFGAFMTVFRCPHGKLVNYLLQSELLKRQINEHLGATINQITNKSLNSFWIPLPGAKTEIRAIESVLSDVDFLLTGLDRLLAKKRDFKQAAMQQLLTGHRRLPGLGDAWRTGSIGELVEIVSGGTPATSEPICWGGGIKWCTPTDITASPGKYLGDTARTISAVGLRSSGARLLPAGTLLLCSRATIGELKIASHEVCTNQGFKSLVCLVQCAALFCTYRAAVARAVLARVTFAKMSLALAVQMNGLGLML